VTELLTIECKSPAVFKRLLVESHALTFMPRFLVDEQLDDERLAASRVHLSLRVTSAPHVSSSRILGAPGTSSSCCGAHDPTTAGTVQ
jgi:hypothetical protein